MWYSLLKIHTSKMIPSFYHKQDTDTIIIDSALQSCYTEYSSIRRTNKWISTMNYIKYFTT